MAEASARPPADVVAGTILRARSGFYSVSTPIGMVEAQLRGRVKRERRATDLAVIGDRVRVALLPDGRGVIEQVEPRRSRFSRRKPDPAGRDRSWREDVLVANVDQVVVVFACARPEPNLRLVDRFLVAAEASEVAPVVVANKIDLVPDGAAHALFGPYQALGYRLLYTSAKSASGIEELRGCLAGRTSILTGPSGVGKSTLLNAIQPGLRLRTAEISDALGKGRHTTVAAELHPLDGAEGGFVADTPGLRELGLWEVPPDELAWCFPEFRSLLGGCAFNDCRHVDEPRCAIRAGVASGAISAERYDSYRRMLRDVV
ncbi:MAG TPA: ribosome small subunit-dependent GTPase A [Candidatus Limnocylindria bacterium]|nr:ribosome small subunit-dependent GTPase A [Candidatus Limnocylindria bacterium]